VWLQESAAYDDWWAAGGLSTEVAGVQAEGEMLPAHWVVDYTSSGREFWRDTNTGLSSMNAPGTTRIYKYGKWGNWASEGAQSRAGDCGAAARGHPLPEVQAQGLCAAVTGSSAQGTWDVDDQGHFDVLWPEPELEAAAQPGYAPERPRAPSHARMHVHTPENAMCTLSYTPIRHAYALIYVWRAGDGSRGVGMKTHARWCAVL